MPRVRHFEVHASDPEKLIRFYSALLEWRFEPWGPPGAYWIIHTGEPDQPGINGGLLPRRGAAPVEGQAVNAYVCTTEVPDLARALAHATELGGTIAVPTVPIPGVGWLAYVKDPDGNILGLTQFDSQAK
jgi:predicted enzyme related to lactoylglutathione lyase